MPPVGAPLQMMLDWTRRHRHMRVHTALHLLSVVIPLPVTGGQIDTAWQDPEGVVTDRAFFSRADLEFGRIRFKPDSLPAVAWGNQMLYDPLERIVR